MKLHFESDLPYQAAAIEAVCDLFRGQEVCRSEFTVTLRAAPAADGATLQGNLEGMQETDQGGIGNRLTLLDEVDSISRTPYCSYRRSPKCPNRTPPSRPIRRNFVSR